jgi:hypothetical protein
VGAAGLHLWCAPSNLTPVAQMAQNPGAEAAGWLTQLCFLGLVLVLVAEPNSPGTATPLSSHAPSVSTQHGQSDGQRPGQLLGAVLTGAIASRLALLRGSHSRLDRCHRDAGWIDRVPRLHWQCHKLRPRESCGNHDLPEQRLMAARWFWRSGLWGSTDSLRVNRIRQTYCTNSKGLAPVPERRVEQGSFVAAGCRDSDGALA